MKHLLVMSLGIPALQLIVDQIVRHLWVAKGGSKWHLGLFLVGIFCSWAVWFSVSLVMQLLAKSCRKTAHILALVLSLVVSVLLVTNAFLFQFFGEYLFPGAVAFVTEDTEYLLDCLKNYLSIGSFLVIVVLVTWHYVSIRPIKSAPSVKMLVALLFVVLGLGSFALNRIEKLSEYHLSPDVVMIESLSKHFLRVKEKVWPLRPANRITCTSGKKAVKPKTVILILNESMGIRSASILNHFVPSCDGCIGLKRLQHQIQSDTSSFVVFEKAYTSSLATQVSMPSIFSGISPEQSHRVLHRVPLLWDMAKAAGYRTGYFTSQRIRWASMSDFLLHEPIDTLVSKESTNHSTANDMGMDDFYTLQAMEAWISAHPNENLFLLWNTNALHAPFQEKSDFMDLSQVAGSRYEKALELIDSVTSGFFELLKKNHRWDDAMILNTGDHGESPTPYHALSRLNSNYEEMIRLPIWIKIPTTLKVHAIASGLKGNKNKIISNIDLAPTLAQMWDIQMNDSVVVSGHSLGKPVDENRVLTVLSTNDTRMWAGEGFGLIHADYRYILIPKTQRALFQLSTDPKQDHNILNGAPDSIMQPFLQKIESNPWLSRIHQHYLQN